MKGLRRLIFILVAVALVAAVPMSAVASDNILKGDVQHAEGQFKQSLSAAVQGGLDQTTVDQMMWRYILVETTKPDAWWQAPIVEHSQLDKLNQMQADLQTEYQKQVAQARDGLQRQLHQWNQMLADASNAGVSADGLDVTTERFINYSAMSSTPNAFVAMATVLADETTILDGRMAAYRDARAQADAAIQNARSLLASAGQYPQLSLAGFEGQLKVTADSLAAVHSADAFAPLIAQAHQAAASVQGLLDARTAAYNQLADTRSTLATAQSIGAALGNHPATISSLANQLPSASDQGTFQSISSQLYQEKQSLASAIYLKQQVPVSYNAGAGKVIVISLSRQVLTAYQDGNAVLTSFVATGRPALPTPPGVYHIFARYAPYQMISPWPRSSPFWYPNSWTNFAMEFAGGGYFIHDAPWRSWYGPGSNIYNGTHGCVNVPYSPMAFLWNWSPIGTTVVVQY